MRVLELAFCAITILEIKRAIFLFPSNHQGAFVSSAILHSSSVLIEFVPVKFFLELGEQPTIHHRDCCLRSSPLMSYPKIYRASHCSVA
ncbi:hypothetical protein CEXT_683261 [Caerostris extrusa]|uniref:Secreted protein n=1 Tax=Caerostris extrusa TaxID=172846 RepID=A0AAV4V8C7_CAEEX|nr:hypothetical protein CEXT_683261 [Caerostris extrusa]